MTDITEFLRARLDEDQAAAEAAVAGPWHHNPGKEWFTDLDRLRAARAGVPQSGGEEFVGTHAEGRTVAVAATGPADDPQSMADADHIARHDPARVLAQVAAMRAVVAEYERAKADIYSSSAADMEDALGPIVRQIAAIWRDHDDYDPAWAPEGE